MVDALASGASVHLYVEVQVLSRAPRYYAQKPQFMGLLFLRYTMAMKRKQVAIFVIFILIVAAAAFGWWQLSNRDYATTPQVIRGKVTAINNGCFADGTCSVTLDNSMVIVTGCGLMANGKTCKSYDQSKLHGGQRIEATVLHEDSGMYSLECNTCSIRVIE
jgi:hypothetical protein